MITRRTFLGAAVATAIAPRVFGAEAPAAAKIMTRKIPTTGEEIPVIGLGTYGGMMTKDVTDATLAPKEEVFRILYEAGGRLIDTAPSYGNAEEVIGMVTAKLGMTDKLFMATKVLERGGEADGIASFNRSLERLNLKKLDLMQCHNFIEWDTHLKTMRKWKDEGKFRYIGVTHYQDHAHAELEKIIKRDKPDFLQINYSAAETKSADRLLPVAKDLGIAVLINRPFAAGEILRQMKDKPLPEPMKPFATSWAQALIKFVLANDAVTCVIGATGNPDHMRDNLQAGFGNIPHEEACKALMQAVA